MKILVTGGAGVVGAGTVTELLKRDHAVVLLSRHATAQAKQWPDGVIAREGDVTDTDSLAGAADGCDAVLHMVGIVEESPPETTFARINVIGTRHMLAEAERARVPRFVFVSSLGAPVGKSDYHRSKRAAESAVRGFTGSWTICRPGNVYGPGDKQISLLLRLVRGVSSLVPMVGDGDQPFQPLWWEDAASALAEVVERQDLDTRELDIAGDEITSQGDLFTRFSAITGRNVHSIPTPEFLATLGAKAISLVGWEVSLSDDQLQMLTEGNVIPSGATNALTDVLGIVPTPLDEGLRKLTEQQPEQLPNEGIGSLERKRFWVDIAGCTRSPEELFDWFRCHFGEVTPVFVEVGPEPSPATQLDEGDTVTLALPLRGHVQVRALDLGPRSVTLVTLAGHPLAGAVRFLCEQRGNAVRFQVEVFERAANLLDLIAMRTIGGRLQDHTWTHLVERVLELSEGTCAEGIQQESVSLDDAEAKEVGQWLQRIITDRKREANAAAIEQPV